MSAGATVLAPWATTLPAGIDTPSLVLDRPTMEANLGRMADVARAGGALLRPHAKTHKIPAIGHRQLELGAVGLTVATLGEAEVFADAGCDDLFVAFPLWVGGAKSARLRALHERTRLRVGLDSAESAAALAGATAGATPLHVMVEVDCGMARSGVQPATAGDIALAAVRLGLHVDGAFTFAGQVYDDPQARPGALRAEQEALDTAAASMHAAGVACAVVSGGSTPNAGDLVRLTAGRRGGCPPERLDGAPALEVRPGSYVFNDRMQVALGAAEPHDVALVVAATVVSVADADRFVIDAGSKVLSSDRPPWLAGYGQVVQYPDASVVRLSEHHGVVEIGPGRDRPSVGDVVAVVPNHVCNVVNLSDRVVVRDGKRPLARWSVAAAGRNA